MRALAGSLCVPGGLENSRCPGGSDGVRACVSPVQWFVVMGAPTDSAPARAPPPSPSHLLCMEHDDGAAPEGVGDTSGITQKALSSVSGPYDKASVSAR